MYEKPHTRDNVVSTCTDFKMKAITSLFALFAGLFLLHLGSAGAAKTVCVGNTEHRSCQPCDSFCNAEPQVCTLQCKRGNFCGCKAGYVRPFRGSSQCVKPEYCPPPPKVNCVGNTTYTGCQPCDSNCNQDTRICPLICRKGDFCGCKAGYVRPFDGSSQCVKKQDCPPPKVNCVGNTTRTTCRPCDSYCNQEPQICTLECEGGDFCGCQSGYVRPFNGSSQCIKREDCPPPKVDCVGNTTFTGCQPCDSTCNQPTRLCTKECIAGDYCRCNTDYLLLPDNSSRCVERQDCPPPKVNCVGNTTYAGCEPCDSYCNEETQFCTLECRFGDFCACKDAGYVRLFRGSSECVKKEDCPQLPACPT